MLIRQRSGIRDWRNLLGRRRTALSGWRSVLAFLAALSLPCAWFSVTAFHLKTPSPALVDFTILLLISPVVEEWVFRGLLLGELRQSGASDAAALGVSSLLFALLHAPAAGWLFLLWLVPGAALG